MRTATLRATIAVASTLAVVLALPAGAQAGFGEPIKVTPSGADPFGYPSDVGFDRSGETTVETVSEKHILVFTRPLGGSFSGGEIGTGTKASMAVGADGAAVSVWSESATTVKVEYRASAGAAFAPAASFPGVAVGNVAAGIDANGNAVVAWTDGAIHYALSTGAAFGSAEEAPLGATPGFEGRGEDPQRDHGPRAFRDDAGNVILAYRDGANATVAHRAASGAWDKTVLSASSTDLQADADSTSGRLIVGYTISGKFVAAQGSTSSSTLPVVVEQPASSARIFSVAVQRAGSVAAAFWTGSSNELLGAGSLSGFKVETIAPGPDEHGVLGAVTTGSDEVVYYVAAPGLQRASRVPGGTWTNTPFEVSNYGTLAVGAGFGGEAFGLFVDFGSDTGITGFPYCEFPESPSGACAAAIVSAPAPAPGPVGPPESAPAAPRLGVSGNVALLSGTVLVRLPGSSRLIALSTLRQIPFGSVIEATRGAVSVTTAAPHGGTQTGIFHSGEFRLTQGRDGLVVATLTGGSYALCPTARERAHRAQASASHASGKHIVRKLWANAHGSFSTRGNYAAGVVQGTEWLTEDLCEGTLIRVTRDKVKVTDLVRHRTVSVRVGHTYLAKAR
jgi:hypothetical protein